MSLRLFAFFVSVAFLLQSASSSLFPGRGFPQQEEGFSPLDFGVTPLNFDRFDRVRNNISQAGDSEVDVAAALQSWASSYCAPGGGYSEYGTGPFCTNNCHNCVCNQNADGSYTWCGYPYNCVGFTWGLTNLTYGQADEQPGTPFIINETFNNTLNISQSFTFSKQETYSNTYSWTFSTTISDSMSVSVTAGIPDVCSVSDSFSTSISVTTSDTQTSSHTDQWSVDQNFNVPPFTAVQATMTITTATFNVPYTALIRFQGVGYSWCNSQVNGHYCWFPWASNFLNFGGCYSSDGMDAICPFAGNFYGLQGVDAAVTITKI